MKWLSYSLLNNLLKDRMVVFFGRGNWVLKTASYLSDHHRFGYIVDNNKYEWGQVRELGLTVYSPDKLLSETRDVIVIITTSHFKEVYNQLQGMYLPPNVTYYVSPALKDYKAQVEIGEHQQIIYLTCSDAPNPGHPTSGGGLYSYNTENGYLRKLFRGKTHGIVRGKSAYYLVDDESCGVVVLDIEMFPTRGKK